MISCGARGSSIIRLHDFSNVLLVYHLCYSFGGTPFKRSIESPSAWKSPWFINSFLPCPRIDTEITIQVIEVRKMQNLTLHASSF